MGRCCSVLWVIWFFYSLFSHLFWSDLFCSVLFFRSVQGSHCLWQSIRTLQIQLKLMEVRLGSAAVFLPNVRWSDKMTHSIYLQQPLYTWRKGNKLHPIHYWIKWLLWKHPRLCDSVQGEAHVPRQPLKFQRHFSAVIKELRNGWRTIGELKSHLIYLHRFRWNGMCSNISPSRTKCHTFCFCVHSNTCFDRFTYRWICGGMSHPVCHDSPFLLSLPHPPDPLIKEVLLRSIKGVRFQRPGQLQHCVWWEALRRSGIGCV